MTRATARLALLLAVVLTRGPVALAMSMTVDGTQVVLSGPVIGGECGQLQAILQQSTVRTVALAHSHGGDAKAGFCVGDLIRARGLDTVIRGSCNSSCSIMWLGGVSRRLEGKDARVGMHGEYDKGKLKSDARPDVWIPNHAPGVNRELMARWMQLPKKYDMMYFYNDRAKLCENEQCTPLPGWNAVNAGLATR